MTLEDDDLTLLEWNNVWMDRIDISMPSTCTGVELGFLEWWGCNTIACAKKIGPRPLY